LPEIGIKQAQAKYNQLRKQKMWKRLFLSKGKAKSIKSTYTFRVSFFVKHECAIFW